MTVSEQIHLQPGEHLIRLGFQFIGFPPEPERIRCTKCNQPFTVLDDQEFPRIKVVVAHIEGENGKRYEYWHGTCYDEDQPHGEPILSVNWVIRQLLWP